MSPAADAGYQQQMQGTVAGHAREGPISAYRHPAPGFGAVSSPRGSTSTPVATGMLHHQVQPQMQFSAEGSVFKSEVTVLIQMPYIVCEESESPIDSSDTGCSFGSCFWSKC